jgi:hypothetical protein
MKDNWIWALVVLPVVIAYFKTELGKFINAYSIYKLKSFDIDGNKNTEDKLQILNGATGSWGDVVVEDYIFFASSKTRGIYLVYPDGGREKVSFNTWSTFRVRTPPPEGDST